MSCPALPAGTSSSRYQAVTGESPWWDARGGRVLWVDIRGNAVIATDWRSKRDRAWPVSGLPSFVVPTSGEALLVATGEGLALMGRDGALSRSPRPIWLPRGMRCNDGTVDPNGRLIIGTMALDQPDEGHRGGIYLVEPNGSARQLLGGLGVVNGLAFSPDGDVLYVADSLPTVRRVWRLSYDKHDGAVRESHLFADFALLGLSGTPDGACVDRRGNYLIAAHGAGLIHRFAPNGDRLCPIPAAAQSVSKAAFAGPLLDCLAITSFGRDAGPAEREAGCLAITTHDGPGLPLPQLSW